jgi:phage shock protein PspC (stress-responsive transcriptional regulator)
MQRNFSDRVLGGVCAGLAASLHLRAWLVRVLFVVLTVLSAGAFVAAYLILWWLTPQQSAVLKRRTLPVVLALLVLAGAALLAILNWTGQLVTPDGVSLYLPILALCLTTVFALRQIGGRTS